MSRDRFINDDCSSCSGVRACAPVLRGVQRSRTLQVASVRPAPPGRVDSLRSEAPFFPAARESPRYELRNTYLRDRVWNLVGSNGRLTCFRSPLAPPVGEEKGVDGTVSEDAPTVAVPQPGSQPSGQHAIGQVVV